MHFFSFLLLMLYTFDHYSLFLELSPPSEAVILSSSWLHFCMYSHINLCENPWPSFPFCTLHSFLMIFVTPVAKLALLC